VELFLCRIKFWSIVIHLGSNWRVHAMA
jgi:hypothetical protein